MPAPTRLRAGQTRLRELKSKKGEKLRAWFDFVFGFENKKGDILGHWIAFHDNFSFPPQEFFDTVEKELEARKIPGLEISRVDFSEGGLLSDRRIYLRLFRERLALYTCASPFGTGYFFSCRTVYVPALVRLWHIIAALLFFIIVGGLLMIPLGTEFTIAASCRRILHRRWQRTGTGSAIVAGQLGGRAITRRLQKA
jgi:hypothetical protein